MSPQILLLTLAMAGSDSTIYCKNPEPGTFKGKPVLVHECVELTEGEAELDNELSLPVPDMSEEAEDFIREELELVQ